MPALAELGLPLRGLVLVTGLMTLVWVASLLRQDASLVDRWWGLAFVLLAWSWHWPSPRGTVPTLMVALVTVWGFRLSVYLTWRNWSKGEDRRYTTMRERRGRGFALWSLPAIHWLQAALAWIIAMPLLAAATPGPDPWWPAALLGLVCWLVGFVFETVGDWQLARHLADPARRGQVLDTGLWRYTRHPNYFGDAMVWWGLWLLSASTGGWWTVFGPVVMTVLLVRVSGAALLEKDLTSRRPGYREYVARTSGFIPWPPRDG